MKPEKIQRFLTAQNQSYLRALDEVKAGYKVTHWMWYIFPQLKGLGRSEVAEYYALDNLCEASDYLRHPVLGPNLIEISTALLLLEGRSAHEIFGSPDDLKLRSCMTLFAKVDGTSPVFNGVIDKYYGGFLDTLTLQLLEDLPGYL
ncbi:DUF1810 domain-containing protein [Pedobacter sp. GSP4]|uniref:DUF1810 domain-containing protein n=1 Tax=Pedobacter sp. GSP4 TaxID=3453716 RepID=UPI003EEE5C59